MYLKLRLKWGSLRYILLYLSRRLFNQGSKTIAGYKTHRLLNIAHTYLFSTAPTKEFLPLLPLIHMYQISCSRNAHTKLMVILPRTENID